MGMLHVHAHTQTTISGVTINIKLYITRVFIAPALVYCDVVYSINEKITSSTYIKPKKDQPGTPSF